jgi:DNA-binding LytR/AlgR family response regulator
VVTVALSAVNVFMGRATPVRTHAAAGGGAPARFLDRLPPRLRGATLHAVQAEDHYLRLHTDRGSDLILMRLSDAVAELEGLEGAQTHRSWWVARDAVRDVKRNDGRAALTLEGGVVAPVSRRYARALREAGWY